MYECRNERRNFHYVQIPKFKIKKFDVGEFHQPFLHSYIPKLKTAIKGDK